MFFISYVYNILSETKSDLWDGSQKATPNCLTDFHVVMLLLGKRRKMDLLKFLSLGQKFHEQFFH